jgi:hypothetical protein
MDVFDPMPTSTTSLSVSNASANTTISIPAASPGSLTVRVYNSTTVAVFVEFGTSSTLAASTSTSMPIPAGNVETFSIGSSTRIAGITASGSGTLYVTPGRGA